MRRDERKAALSVEPMETRFLPSGGMQHKTPPQNVFVATLTPGNVVLPLDFDKTQIEAGGGGALFPTPPADDPARGKIVFTVTGNEIKVSGSLSHISNVTAITIHDLNYPAAFPLRGTTTSPATQPPALPPGTPAIPATVTTVTSSTATPAPTPTPAPTETTTTSTVSSVTAGTSVPIYTTTSNTTTVGSPVTNADGSVSLTTSITSITTSGAVMPVINGNTITPTPPAPIYYDASTVNSAAPAAGQTSQDGQVLSSNTGQTVELLLNPGTASGPLPSKAQFNTVIKAQYLLGPLAKGKGFHNFLHDLRKGRIYVLVQTNDGYDQGTGAQEDSSFPNGELRSQDM
jgi:hypothetical protein